MSLEITHIILLGDFLLGGSGSNSLAKAAMRRRVLDVLNIQYWMYCPGSFSHLTFADNRYQIQGGEIGQPQVEYIVCREIKTNNKTY